MPRDSGKETVETFLENLVPRLQTAEELEELRGIDGASGGEEGGAAARPRVHAADIQLTFNHDWCQGDGVEVWFAGWGQELVQRLLTWAREEFPSRFAPNRVAHTSLTIEQSMSSHQPRVHVHCQFTFARRIDRTNYDCFKFGGLRPHVRCNHARGRDVEVSRARAHFYVYCSKVGSLWNFTDWHPFIDYEVNPAWVTKFTHTTYQRYLLQCRRNYRTFLQNAEAVLAAEKSAALKTYQEKVVEVLSRTRLPFRHVNDPLFPNLPPFLDQFTYAQERYRLYALQGPSQAAKTSFVKSLFKRPFVLTVQNATTLNLRDFKYGFHDCLILDNVNTLKFILDYRAILQSNLDTHVLGDSATNVYSYTIFLWGTPILITLDCDVDVDTEMAESEWLQANIMLDKLLRGSVCYQDGERQQIRMADMPKLELPN
ncbi:unnamed protein product [Effrenium voratum]|nr:unnamed protein product [Effrenium voratum]